METNDMIKCISELSEKLTESERFTQQLSKKLEKALYELHHSIGAWVPLKQKAYYREQLQIVRDAMPPDPLPSDRDVARLVIATAQPNKITLIQKSDMTKAAALIAAHREAAVKTEREVSKLLAEKLRNYLPHCGKQDMTNHEKELVEMVEMIVQGDGK